MGEGSVSIVLESETSAKARGAKKYAELAGWASAHKSVEFGTINGSEDALKKVILDACTNAGITPAEVGGIFGFANGHPAIDALERDVLSEIFGADSDVLKNVVEVKQTVGEARAAASAKQAAKAAECLSAEDCAYKYALAVSFGLGGQYSAVVLKKCED